MPKRVLLIGGPSTGKTTLLKHLHAMGHPCLEEVSRGVIREAQAAGIDQLFLEKPLLFSELLREARIKQFKEVTQYDDPIVFIDRGIPDTVAYMEYIGQKFPKAFTEACTIYRYDTVFVLPPWEEIHVVDQERYETFEQAQRIQHHLLETYKKYGYTPIEVPKACVSERAQFILNTLTS